MLLAYKISIGIALLAAIAYARGYVIFGRFRWNAVRQPIDISTSGNYESQFVAQMNSNHVVILGTTMKLEPLEQCCRLGIEINESTNCDDFPQKYLISWNVLHQGESLANGRSDETKAGSRGYYKARLACNEVNEVLPL